MTKTTCCDFFDENNGPASRKKEVAAICDMVCERAIASPSERPDDPMDGRRRTAGEDSDLDDGSCNNGRSIVLDVAAMNEKRTN